VLCCRRMAVVKNSRKLVAPKERTYKPTNAELAAIRKGEAEIARGEFLTLTEFLHEMDRNRGKVGVKAGGKAPRRGPAKS
jgi:predicted transcriptional regulator